MQAGWRDVVILLSEPTDPVPRHCDRAAVLVAPPEEKVPSACPFLTGSAASQEQPHPPTTSL